MRKLILFLLLSVTCFDLTAQNQRKLCVLDMTNYSSETNNGRFIGAIQVARTAGIPFDTTSNLFTALNYPVILLGSRIVADAFTIGEETALINYVANGGVLIHSNIRDTTFFPMCGISASTNSSTLYNMQFDTAFAPELFYLIDDSLEVEISLGRSSMGTNYALRYYTTTTSYPLATYENGSCALAYNQFVNGHVYTFGPDLRDLTLRNQLDLDNNAHRTYSNGFEPSTDVIIFLIRNIFGKHVPHLVYTHTSPGTSSSVILLTHDIDSWSGMDTMQVFSSWELSNNIPAHYNITTRYTNDGWMTNFYIGSWSRVNEVKNDGHTLSSHSVGHFPDFDNESRFPYGNTGNIPASYQPFYTGGITSNGSVMGELEVSRNLLENDHSVNIRSFRAGHLAFHDSLIIGLQQLDYEFNSTHSANNILFSYPYFNYLVRSFNAVESRILEIPMTISDVFTSDPIDTINYPQKVGIWTRVTRKYVANNAPINLLIHPNRMWKLTAQQMYFDSIPNDLLPYSFEEYGEFWRKRDSLRYLTQLSNDTLYIKMLTYNLSGLQSFVIDYNGLDSVLFFDANGIALNFDWIPFHTSKRLYYSTTGINSIVSEDKNKLEIEIFPNPGNEYFNIRSSQNISGSIQLFDIHGRLIYEVPINDQKLTRINTNHLGLNNGIYIFRVISKDSNWVQQVVYMNI